MRKLLDVDETPEQDRSSVNASICFEVNFKNSFVCLAVVVLKPQGF